MAQQKLVWEAQSNDIWKLASELQNKSSEIDVYLQTSKSSDSILKLLNNEVLLNISKEDCYFSKNTTEVTCFPAHKLMLSAASPFFQKLLHEHYNDYRDTCVTVSLPHIPAYCISYILDFIYCGNVNIHPKIVEHVLEVAKLLEISCLVLYFKPSLCFEQRCMPIQKEKKRKPIKNKVLQNIKNVASNSQDENLNKKDKSVVQLSRSSRKIKSRYSSDIYEVNLPKLRKTRSKKTNEIDNNYIQPIDLKHKGNKNTDLEENVDINESQFPKEDENHHSYALNPDALNDCNFNRNTFICQVKNSNKFEENKHYKLLPSSTFALDLSSSKIPENMKNISKNYISKENKKDSLISTSLIDGLIESIHNTCKHKVSNLQDQNYGDNTSENVDDRSVTMGALQNIITVQKGNNKFEETSDSIDVIRAFETQEFGSGLPNTTTNMLKHVQSQLSKQDKSSVDGSNIFSLEQLAISLKPSEVSLKPSRVAVAFTGIDNVKQDDGYEVEEEEEDGLFKLQVLLKECEDFPDSEGVDAAVVEEIEMKPDGSHHIKYPGVEGSIDINQWISEEIHNYMMPKIDQPESHLSKLQGNKLKKDIVITDTCTSLEQQEEKQHIQIDQPESHISNLQGNKLKKDIVIADACASIEQQERKKHIQEIPRAESDFPDSEEVEVMEEKTEYQCEECSKIFDNLRSIQSHIRGVHDGAKQMCKICGKLFKRRCDLYYHERRHNNAELPCKVCGKSFKLKKDLNAHMTTHLGGKRFTCAHCNKGLTSQRNLKNHIASVHFKHRGFICNMCNKSYSKDATLQVHIRSVHTGERPYKCEVCDKSFADSSLLKIHQYKHTGERKYACKVCGRCFNQYSNLMNHSRVHSNERPFVCIICKDKFKSRESLMKHKWIHAGLKPLKCLHCDEEFRIKESFERHMSKLHGENVQIPELYFEISEASENESISHGNVIHSIRDSEITEETDSYLFESEFIEKSHQKKSQNLNSNSGTEIVNGIPKDSLSELPTVSNSGSKIHFTYPVLASHLTSESGNAMNILSNSVSGNTDPESIDMESLISTNDNLKIGRSNTSNSNILTKKSLDTDMTSSKHQFMVNDVLKSQPENIVIQRSEKLIVPKNSSGMSQEELTDDGVENLADVGEMTGLDDSNLPSFKIWMRQTDGTLSNVVVDVPEERNHNILIVSDSQVFSDEGQSLSMLRSQVIGHEMIDTVDVNHVQVTQVTGEYYKESQ